LEQWKINEESMLSPILEKGTCVGRVRIQGKESFNSRMSFLGICGPIWNDMKDEGRT
jgi:hypothetical protein